MDPSYLKIAAAAWLIRAIVPALGATWRLRYLKGSARAEDLLANEEPVILASWHDRSLLASRFVRRELLERGYPLTVLVSQSRDGELAARLAHWWGARVIRGSTSRGGTEGLRRLYRAVSKERSNCVNLADGPRGPRWYLKPGAVVLAQTSGAPILPLAFAADRYWTLRSWDRLIIPKPFARVVIAVGEPQVVPRDLPAEGLEGERRRLEDRLKELVKRVEEEAEAN